MYAICSWLEHNMMLQTALNWPPFAAAMEVFHYIGMFLMVGSVVLVDLRIIGVAATRRRLGELSAQMFPYAWTGVGLVAVSGFLMFTSTAIDYYGDPTFHMKMIVVGLALIFAAFVQWRAPVWDRSTIPLSAKLIAVVCLLLMFGAILAGNEVPALSGIG